MAATLARLRKRALKAQARASQAVLRLRRACKCRKCKPHDVRWPTYYVGSVGIGYECWLSVNAEAIAAEAGAPTPDHAALAIGLTIVSGPQECRQKYQGRYVSGCEFAVGDDICNGLRPVGRRYCLSHEQQVRRALAAAGWEQSRIRRWMLGDDGAAEG